MKLPEKMAKDNETKWLFCNEVKNKKNLIRMNIFSNQLEELFLKIFSLSVKYIKSIHFEIKI